MKNVIEVTPYGVFLLTPPIAAPWRWHGDVHELLSILVANPTLSMQVGETEIHVREHSCLMPAYFRPGGYDATLTVICAWCKTVMHQGSGYGQSHGCCASCNAKMEQEVEQHVDRH